MKSIPSNPLPASKEAIEGSKVEASPTGSWASLAQKQPQSTPQKGTESVVSQFSPPTVNQQSVSLTPTKVEIAPVMLEGPPVVDVLPEKRESVPVIVSPFVDPIAQLSLPKVNGDLGVRHRNEIISLDRNLIFIDAEIFLSFFSRAIRN